MPRDLATRLAVAADTIDRLRMTAHETGRGEARAAARDRRPMDPLAADMAAAALASAIDLAAERIAATCAPGPGPAARPWAPDIAEIGRRLRDILEHRWLGRHAEAERAITAMTAWLSAPPAEREPA